MNPSFLTHRYHGYLLQGLPENEGTRCTSIGLPSRTHNLHDKILHHHTSFSSTPHHPLLPIKLPLSISLQDLYSKTKSSSNLLPFTTTMPHQSSTDAYHGQDEEVNSSDRTKMAGKKCALPSEHGELQKNAKCSQSSDKLREQAAAPVYNDINTDLSTPFRKPKNRIAIYEKITQMSPARDTGRNRDIDQDSWSNNDWGQGGGGEQPGNYGEWGRSNNDDNNSGDNGDDHESHRSERPYERFASLGPNHDSTAKSAYEVAYDLCSYHEREDAEDLFGEEVDVRVQCFGPEHPETLKAMDERAKTLRMLGRHEDSENLFWHTVKLRSKVQGPENHETLEPCIGWLLNLANLVDTKIPKDS